MDFDPGELRRIRRNKIVWKGGAVDLFKANSGAPFAMKCVSRNLLQRSGRFWFPALNLSNARLTYADEPSHVLLSESSLLTQRPELKSHLVDEINLRKAQSNDWIVVSVKIKINIRHPT